MATFLQLPKDELLQCRQLLIPAGFWVDENENVYTPEISVLYRLATNKKDLSELEKSFMVRDYRIYLNFLNTLWTTPVQLQ